MRLLAASCVAIGLLLTGCGDDPYGSASSDGAPPDDGQEYEASLTVLESPDHGPELCNAVAESFPPQCGGVPVRGWDWDAVEAESANGTTWGEYHVVGTFDGEALTLTQPPGPAEPLSDLEERVHAPGCDEPDVVDASHGQLEWDEASSLSAAGIPGSIGAWISRPEAGGDGTFSATVVVTTGQREEAATFVRRRYGGPLCVVERDLTQAEIDATQEELHDEEATSAIRTTSSSYNLVEGVFEVGVWVADDDAKAYAQDRWGDLVVLQAVLQPVSGSSGAP